MYVVNIVGLRGPIACHRLACAGLSTSSSPSACTRTGHKHTSFQNAAPAGVRQVRLHQLFNWTIILTVHSHLIASPEAASGDRGTTYGEH